MRFFEGGDADLFQGDPIHGNGIVPAHKATIIGNPGIVTRPAVTFSGYIQAGIDEHRFTLYEVPHRRRRFYKLFLKDAIITFPAYPQGHLRTKADALCASDAQLIIELRIFSRRLAGGAGRTYLGTQSAFYAALLNQLRLDIGVHALLLGARSKSHRDVLDGASETRCHMPLEVGKYDEEVCIIKDIGNLNRFEMLARGRNVNDPAPVFTIGHDEGATKVVLVIPVLPGGLDGFPGAAPPAGIKYRRVENIRLQTFFDLPGDNFLKINRRQKRPVSPLAPVGFDAYPCPGGKWAGEFGQQPPQRGQKIIFCRVNRLEKISLHHPLLICIVFFFPL
ncbi:MAG TPA: hypothetical protein P5172_11865 [Syntrophales bacterium]|nr:hypothetical protein [Syntrophales bacterium]HRR48284.1 hypothetical protein [Syntrophales bacterium]HRU89631.1 hypothetical protein [Syntrophales bacterium]